MEKIKYGLVLSGGGSRGAYEIGVYKALRKMHIDIDIITGTSIGALNGAVLTQKDFKLANKIWKKINFEAIYDDSIKACDNPRLRDIYMQFAKSFVKDGGMDTSKISKLLDENLNPKKFFKSDIDFGLVTYNLTKNEPVIKTKKELNENNLKDYVLASCSCYPAFQPYIINNEKYIDGGYYDNLPINLCAQMGAEEIIAVDLKAVGLKRTIRTNVPITMISPRNKIASFLVFDKNTSKESINFGYNDTLKTFGKLDGDNFTFKKGDLAKNYARYGDKYIDELHEFFSNAGSGFLNMIISSSLFKDFMAKRLTYKKFNFLIQKAGEYYHLKEDKIYHIRFYNYKLVSALKKTEILNLDLIIKRLKNHKFRNAISKREIVKIFYLYILDNNLKGVMELLPVFTNEFLCAFYIYIVKKH